MKEIDFETSDKNLIVFVFKKVLFYQKLPVNRFEYIRFFRLTILTRFGEIKLNNFLLPLSIRIIERLLSIKEFHQIQQNAKKKDKKIGKTNRLSKIEEEKVRANVDDLMERYVSKDTSPINDIRKFFGIEKDSFIKNTVLMDVPFLFEDECKNCY